MMKNIYIVGVPRAGKSTLSKFIKNRYPFFNQISFEAIRNGFMESQPELDMGNRRSDARKNIMPKHIVTYAHWNNVILLCPSLVEGDFCSIEELYDLIDENDSIICLGLGCRPIEEIVDGIQNNDTDKDYTKEWPRERLLLHFSDITISDKHNYDFCMKHNIPYYDTYDNRTNIFETIVEHIEDIK
jgi:hypothetical protein